MFRHINWETGEVYPPFFETPTPTPTLIDVLAQKLWEADGRPTSEERNEKKMVEWYGDFFAANAFGCKMDYVEFYDLVVSTAQKVLEEHPDVESPHIKVISHIREMETDESCAVYLSNMLKLFEDFRRSGWIRD